MTVHCHSLSVSRLAMIVTSGSSLAGHRVASTAGLVLGNNVRAGHLGPAHIAWLKNLVGRGARGISDSMVHAHDRAMDRMIRRAEALGATAVVDVRISTAYVMDSVIEILVYGNAVVLDKR